MAHALLLRCSIRKKKKKRCSISTFINFLSLGQWFSNQDICPLEGIGDCWEPLLSKQGRGKGRGGYTACSETDMRVFTSDELMTAPFQQGVTQTDISAPTIETLKPAKYPECSWGSSFLCALMSPCCPRDF